jgi:hypothetical protein
MHDRPSRLIPPRSPRTTTRDVDASAPHRSALGRYCAGSASLRARGLAGHRGTAADSVGPVATASAAGWSAAAAAAVRPPAAPLRHPNGSAFYPNVIRWANTVQAVMKELGIPARYLPGILAQFQQESSGRPNAVNRTDSNARRGYASMGLLQVIAPTYRTYAKPGFKGTLIRSTSAAGMASSSSSPWMTSPFTNIWAALNYVLRTYGMGKFDYWNRGWNSAY